MCRYLCSCLAYFWIPFALQCCEWVPALMAPPSPYKCKVDDQVVGSSAMLESSNFINLLSVWAYSICSLFQSAFGVLLNIPLWNLITIRIYNTQHKILHEVSNFLLPAHFQLSIWIKYYSGVHVQLKTIHLISVKNKINNKKEENCTRKLHWTKNINKQVKQIEWLNLLDLLINSICLTCLFIFFVWVYCQCIIILYCTTK